MEAQKTNRRIIVGLVMVVAGLLLLMNNFDLIPWSLSHILFNWQMILVVIGVLMMTNPQSRTTGLILIAVGGFFLIPRVFDLQINFWGTFWPALIIFVGGLMIFRHKIDHGRKDFSGKLAGSEFIDEVAIFGGGEKIVESPNFKGGRVTCIFGGSEINLLGSELSPEENVIDVFTLFGGSSFMVPDHWQVKLDVVSIFGGYSDKRSTGAHVSVKSDKVIVIKGVVLFGGGEIKSYRTK